MTTSISRDELEFAMAAGAVTVVDALPAFPYRQRHLPGALNLVAEEAGTKAASVLPDRDAPIVTYSTNAVCGRGEALAARLVEIGYTDVRVYRDGIEEWARAGRPLA